MWRQENKGRSQATSFYDSLRAEDKELSTIQEVWGVEENLNHKSPYMEKVDVNE